MQILKYPSFNYNSKKIFVKNMKIYLDTMFNFFFCFQGYIDCFIMQSRKKKTYLYMFYLIIINGTCVKTLMFLNACFKFF